MIDSYHIYFKGEILFKNLSKLYTSYINALDKELTYEIITENNLNKSVHNFEPSF